MKEASEEKRKLLRNYLLNVGKGINPDFNEYTRMNNVMDTITLYEIDILHLGMKMALSRSGKKIVCVLNQPFKEARQR